MGDLTVDRTGLKIKELLCNWCWLDLVAQDGVQ